MPAQTPRDYQQRGIASIFASWKAGNRTVLCVSPTGSGKTTLFSWIIAQISEARVPSLILVHRRELAAQACNRLREFGVDYGLIMSGEPAKPYALTQVASVQTLVRRTAPPAKLVVCDEAHLSTAKTWAQILAQYPDARILGVTATPWRLSGKPLAGTYDDCVIVATPRDLREQGHLCDYAGFSYLTPDLDAVRTTGGEYNEKDAAAAMSQSLIVDNVVEEWGKHARDLSTVVFGVTVEHSQQMTQRFRAAGVAAEHLDGSTPIEQRRAILARVEQGTTRVLCNVGVAVEGLDIPRLKCCVLARPTKSLSRAIQCMGRVRRPWHGVTARIHDHAFVIRAHGLPDDDRDYTLNAKKDRPPSLSTCPECLALYSGRSCSFCGKAAEQEAPTERVLNTVADAEQFEFSSAEQTAAGTMERPPVDIRWTEPGRVLEGKLSTRWDELTQYGTLRAYMIKGARRDYKFHGTADLNAKLSKAQISDSVRITYIGNTPIPGPGGKHRKNFKVEVDDGL